MNGVFSGHSVKDFILSSDFIYRRCFCLYDCCITQS